MRTQSTHQALDPTPPTTPSRRRRNRLIILVLAAIGCLRPLAATAAEGSSPATPPFTGEVSVREVLLDVLVTDRKGNPILGLGAEDFVVRENGATVPLTDVTFYSTHRYLGSEDDERYAVEVDRTPQDRYFILFFHDQRLSAHELRTLLREQMAAIREAKRWVAAKEPNDWVAVVSYDYKLKVHTDFTKDPAILSAALDRAGEGIDPGAEWPSRLDPQTQPLLAGLPRGTELGKQTESIYDGLRLLAAAAGGVVGRKNLVYFGFGFGRINTFGAYLPDDRYYPAMMQALNDNNVAMYTVDTLASSGEHALSAALNQLAAESGGRHFPNFTSFITPLREIAQETSGYYLLSYRSTAEQPTPGKYQKVDVEVRNPELRVRARSGYLLRGTDPGAP